MTVLRLLKPLIFRPLPAKFTPLSAKMGAGKSTLMKILAGAIQPDAGNFILDGQPIRPRSPHHAFELGIRTVYQEFSLVSHFKRHGKHPDGPDAHGPVKMVGGLAPSASAGAGYFSVSRLYRN